MTETKPRILIVDDELENIDYIRRVLHGKYNPSFAASGTEALELIRQYQFAVILSDIKMPGMSGVEFLSQALDIAPDTVRLILTGYADVDNTIDAINMSRVTGFLRKPVRPEEIEKAIASAAELYSLRLKNIHLVRVLEERNTLLEDKERLLKLSLDDKARELLDANTRLQEMVVRDGLTGLYNHRYFQERTETEVSRAQRYKHQLSLVFIDLDHFKNYNDSNGHPQGDQALMEIADILMNQARSPDIVARVRDTDVVARYGGEEFVVLLPETAKVGARIMAERLRQAIEEWNFPGEDNLPHGRLTASFGIASYPKDAENRADLIARADEALYRAKAAGRNQVCLWEAVQD